MSSAGVSPIAAPPAGSPADAGSPPSPHAGVSSAPHTPTSAPTDAGPSHHDGRKRKHLDSGASAKNNWEEAGEDPEDPEDPEDLPPPKVHRPDKVSVGKLS